MALRWMIDLVLLLRWLEVLLLAGASLAQTAASLAYRDEDPNSFVVQWGQYAYDTRSRELPLSKIVCGFGNTARLRRDGRLFVQGACGTGQQGISTISQVPELPPGMTYVDVSLSAWMGLAVRSDGNIVSWAGMVGPPLAAPLLPPGIGYLRVVHTDLHAIALRSDGQVIAFGDNHFGQCNVPATPPGVSVVDLQVGGYRSALLLSDGQVLFFGDNSFGQNNAPSLPPGVSYTAMAAGANDFTLLLRSDGIIEAFGNSQFGQLNVPALPPGLVYQHIATGGNFGVAVRSDNRIVTWQNPIEYGLDAPPAIPQGATVVALHAYHVNASALLSDGTALTWGHNGFYEHRVVERQPVGGGVRRRLDQVSSGVEVSTFLFQDGTIEAYGLNNAGQCDIPAAPSGMRYLKTGAGGVHTLSLRSDGNVIAVGYNGFGALNVPPLPWSVTYTDLAVEHGHSILLRSDGNAVAFGGNSSGQCNLPTLPSGLSYIKADVNQNKSLLLRSDGTLAYCGVQSSGQANVPAPQPGNPFIDIAACHFFNAALAADNTVVTWGSTGGWFWTPLPPLPFGVYYVEMAGGMQQVALRRSDGQVAVLGLYGYNAPEVPRLDPGTSYVQVSGKHLSIAARGSSTCTYVGFAPGCAGSMPAAKLIPRDTPRIGRTLRVNVRNLPVHIAAVAMGFQMPTTPIPLAAIGMPGCDLRIQVDGVALVAGQQNNAMLELPIPNVRSLVGLRFYNQALVLDPGAGNGLGAVISEASEGVIGFP
jgi:alpha-tubulin suppressor-like RCC1 family protein